MAQLQSFNSKSTTHSFGAFQLLRQLGASVLAITTLLVLIGILISLTGCTQAKGNGDKVASSSSQTNQGQVAVHPPVTVPEKAAVTAKKKPVVRRARTVAYTSSTYGISFRFPGEFDLTTPAQDGTTSNLPESVPTNFVQPGGVTLATIEMPSGASTSFFNVSANKALTAQQCRQFAVPDPSDVAGNSPVDSNDGSIPSKTSIHDVEFSKVENATEQEDVKYYHHFEPNHDGSGGTCYEFAMGVEEGRVTSKTLDYSDLFDKLDRIMATVKINSESSSAAAATAPAAQPSGLSPQ
ncbi:MAG TPA: hypothetical protein VI636_24820 [Candidatus Angelobacter sp.]